MTELLTKHNLRMYGCDKIPNYLEFDWENYTFKSKADYAVIFNFNGVLIDNGKINEGAWAWILEQMRIKNYDKSFLSTQMTGGMTTKEILIGMIAGSSGNKPDNINELAINWANVKEQHVANRFRKKGTEMPGAIELIKILTDNRIKIGLYSTFSRHFVMEILYLKGLKKFFNVIITPETIQQKYFDPNPFEACLSEVLDRLDIMGNQCFLLEDSVGCVQMATRRGVGCIGFGMRTGDNLKDHGALCVVKDHNSLLNIFKKCKTYAEIRRELEKL
jgi:beta-phosphoglucomutase-like phosphatase (HAD superfamily)